MLRVVCAILFSANRNANFSLLSIIINKIPKYTPNVDKQAETGFPACTIQQFLTVKSAKIEGMWR